MRERLWVAGEESFQGSDGGGFKAAAVVVSRSRGGGGCRQRWQIKVEGSRSMEIRGRLKTKGADRSCGEQIDG
ncbi:hypothetical protein L1987_21543 [Smallanthus sonchifolius]|uniref:Uncharacterized protein n=1 Tax=Smallanthus sonchifolius TaxID=185202 RepID=A0ACB9IWE0_9ASTR|nr:hypothetical protein L1987_21543 [Smallanthus sonchifolius]